MKRILITGVSGFVGSNLVRHFISQRRLLIFGHSRNSKSKTAHIEMISACTVEILDGLHIDTVIHLAGIAHDLSDTYQPEDYDRVNFQNTCNVFDVFVKSKATKFIFISSIKAAVDTSSVPVTETIAQIGRAHV